MNDYQIGGNVWVSKEGHICYRSKLLPAAHGETFARCLSRNPQNAGAWFEPWQPRTRTDNVGHVCWVPKDPARRLRMRERLQRAIYERADADAHLYEVRPSTSGINAFDVLKLETGEMRLVTQHRCECENFRFTLNKANLHCKHQRLCGFY